VGEAVALSACPQDGGPLLGAEAAPRARCDGSPGLALPAVGPLWGALALAAGPGGGGGRPGTGSAPEGGAGWALR